MTELETYLQMIDWANRILLSSIEGFPEKKLNTRPGPHQNPAGFIYFHVLRHWDRDINVLIRRQGLQKDAWHRGGFAEELDYFPVGLGYNGLGTGIGYTDAEVDAVPARLDVLMRYQELLNGETAEFLPALSPEQLHQELTHEYVPDATYTPADRIQHLIMHTNYHSGDISYVKGALGVSDPSYPGH